MQSQLENDFNNIIRGEPVSGPCVWRGSDLQNTASWVHTLDDSTIHCLNTALQSLAKTKLHFTVFTKNDFPISAEFSDFLCHCQEELENGKGVLLIRGLPIHQYSLTEIEKLYFGIGLHLGTPVCQNPKGDMLGRVMNVGDLNKKETRVYETNAYLPYHTDLSDVFGLISIRKAQSGGLTSLVSSGAVYNELLAHHRELLGLFYRPMYYAHLGDTDKSPIFSYSDNKLACRYLRQYIELGHELANQPLSSIEIHALDVFDSILHNPSMRLDMMLEPGDMLFANNYTVMHSRSSFTDFDETEKRRQLLRLWLKMPNARKLSAEFPGKNGFDV